MKGFKKKVDFYYDDKYRELEYGTIYYVPSCFTRELNTYVKQHADAIAERINANEDIWLPCKIVYLEADNELFKSSSVANFYTAMLPTKHHNEGTNIFVATLINCDAELIERAFERYYKTLLDVFDQVLDKGTCDRRDVFGNVDFEPHDWDGIQFMIGSGPSKPKHTQLSRLEIIPHTYDILLTDYEEEIHFTAQVKALYALFLLHPEGIVMKDIGDYKEEFKRLYFHFTNRSDMEKLRDSIERLLDLWTPNALKVKKSQCNSVLRRVIPEDEIRAHYEIESHRSAPHLIRLDRKLVTIPECLLK